MNGHMVPAVLGYVFVFLYMLDERLYLLSDLLAIVTLLMIPLYFYLDYYEYNVDVNNIHFGIGVIYMLVIYFKARQIFDNDL